MFTTLVEQGRNGGNTEVLIFDAQLEFARYTAGLIHFGHGLKIQSCARPRAVALAPRI